MTLKRFVPKLISKADRAIPLPLAMGLGITVFGVRERLTGQRATHMIGIGGKGKFKVASNPAIPEHEFFTPGREFPLILRHATIAGTDQAGLYIRSASIRLLADDEETPLLDLLMNSGVCNAFNTVNGFNTVIVSRSLYFYDENKADDLFGEVYPEGLIVGNSSKRRAPSSFDRVYYHSKLTLLYVGKDGITRFCRYRIIPGDRGEESGLPDGNRQISRLKGETRARDYLTTDYRERLEKGDIEYHLQVQFADFEDTYNPVLCDSAKAWPESKHPWLDIGKITISNFLDYDFFKNIYLNIGNHPDSLPLPKAKYSDQYNSLAVMRAKAYKIVSKNRRNA